MEIRSHDILLVGGGGAGLRAAIAAAEVNPKLSIAVVSKVYPMRSHTVSAEGGAAGVAKPDDSLDEHAYDTISGGDWMCDQDAVEAFVKDAPQELLRLERWGCPWNREPDGHIAVRAFGGMKKKRTWFAADKTGFHMLHTLFQTSLKYQPITRYDEWFVTKLLMDDGRVQGVVAIDVMSGKIQAITAKAVIVCTGGCGRIFPFTTNANIKNGDGMALVQRAGAPLKDMEFLQYHPTGLPFTGILITEAARAEGGYMLNKDGYRYLQDYNLGKPQAKPVLRSMELGPRDRLSQAFVKEDQKGRTIPTEYGSVVYLDLRHLGEKLINAKLPFVRELCMKYENIDPVKELIPVRPVVHYMMGGVSTDINGATPLGGLFAAGQEVPNGGVLAQATDEQKRLEQRYLNKTGGTERIATLRDEMQKAVESGAGIYREQSTLSQAGNKLRELQERYVNISLDDHSQTFNTELTSALELGYMLDVAQSIVECALHRTESRGAHQRTDFPERDDKRFLAHSLVRRSSDGSLKVDYLPVKITRWPPGERVYGQEEKPGEAVKQAG